MIGLKAEEETSVFLGCGVRGFRSLIVNVYTDNLLNFSSFLISPYMVVHLLASTSFSCSILHHHSSALSGLRRP